MDDKDSRHVSDELEGVLKGLTPKDLEILRQRFGIAFPDPPSEDFVRAILEITRDRIRNVERKALERLNGSDNGRKS